MCFQSKTSEGDRIQQELFRFVMEDIVGFDSKNALPELKKLMSAKNDVRDLMAAEGWRLVQTAKDSVADLVGMDFIFINLNDDRYFFIDITLSQNTDSGIKQGLPRLRKDSIFSVTVNEDERIDVDTKQRLIDLLFDLMTAPSVLSVRETPPPNYRSKLSYLEVAQQIENFRKQLDLRVANIQREIVADDGPSTLSRDAEILHEFSVHLARALAYARGEHERTCDETYKAKLDHFSAFVRNAVIRSARVHLKLDDSFGKQKDVRGGHTAVWDKRQDQLHLHVGQTVFKLYRVNSLVDGLVAQVCSKVRNSGRDFFALKRELGADCGRARVIASAIDLIHVTAISTLLGETHVIPETKTALRKKKRKANAKAAEAKAA